MKSFFRNKSILVCAYFFLLLGFCSCATFLNHKKNEILIDSFPQGATVQHDNTSLGTTPCIIKIKKKLFTPQYITLQKENYDTATIKLTKKIHGAFWLNGLWLFWPAPIDLLSKQVMYYESPEFVTLKPLNNVIKESSQPKTTIAKPTTANDNSSFNPNGYSLWTEDMPFNQSYFEKKAPTQLFYYDAVKTGAVISSHFVLTQNVKDSILNIDVFSVMNRKYSWFKKTSSKKEREKKLAHEKAHFDITEVYSRKLKKELKTLILTRSNYSAELQYMYGKYRDLLRAAQVRYDKETAHSMNEETQKLWQTKIAAELAATREFYPQQLIFVLK